jgi:5-formyltetrahydrofolate cyclo-ligase
VTAAERKAAQRSIVRARLAAFPQEERRAASARIATRLHALPEWEQARTVALFSPLASEPDPGWPGGKRAALPRLLFDPPGIELREASGPESLVSVLTPQGWTLREPGPDAPVVGPEAVALILVPGIAFDRRGFRLGRGGGWYDRLLSRLPGGALRVGIFFGVQELAEVEAESHDRGLDLILTEQETLDIRLCRSNASPS